MGEQVRFARLLDPSGFGKSAKRALNLDQKVGEVFPVVNDHEPPWRSVRIAYQRGTWGSVGRVWEILHE